MRIPRRAVQQILDEDLRDFAASIGPPQRRKWIEPMKVTLASNHNFYVL
jgi:hypothetical protein